VTGTVSLSPQGDDPARARALSEALGERVGLDAAVSTLPRRGRRVEVSGAARGFGWDQGDAETTSWWPQGLTTAPGKQHRGVVICAWYGRDRARRSNAASRVSLVDLSQPDEPGYAHVLLVQPYRRFWSRRQHSDVAVHAGGLVWVHDLLLVTDTWGGLRVFDLRDVTRLTRVADRPGGHEYVLPQSGHWRAGTRDTRPLRWSFASLDASGADGGWLVAGEYSTQGTGARLARFPLDPLLAGRAASAVEVFATDLRSMQGATRIGEDYWVSTSAGRRRRGDLWTGRSGLGFRRFPGVLPVGPEDLSYDPGRSALWTQTEYPGRRCVLCLPLPVGD